MGGSLVSKFAFIPPTPATYRADDVRFEAIAGGSGHEISIQHVNKGYATSKRSRSSDLVAIYSHGNAEDLGLNADLITYLANVAEMEIVAYDYSGYGPLTNGQVSPNESRAYANIEAVFDYVHDVIGVPDERIVIIGRSLGTGPSCQAAIRHPSIAGLVLISPLASAIKTQLAFTVPGFDIFKNSSKISHVAAPVLIIHGTNDRVVPFAHGEQLAALAPNLYELVAVDGAGHNDLIDSMGLESYFDTIADFVRALPALNASAAAAASNSDLAAVEEVTASSSSFGSRRR